MDRKSSAHVVVVGAGFGGLKAAQALSKTSARVTVVDRTNHHLFQPLLYQVATAGLGGSDIAFPIRSLFRKKENTDVFMAEVVGVDRANRRVHMDRGSLIYDYLILATGSEYNYFGHDEWEKRAPKLKSLSDALRIREDLLLSFELAEMEANPEKRRELLTFVLVGAGPTGVEMAGALAELAYRSLSQDFRKLTPSECHILLLDAMPRILTAFPESLSLKAQRKLEQLGVEVRTNAKVEKIEEAGLWISGQFIRSKNIVWTAGVKASPVGKWLGVEMDKGGRVLVEKDLSLPGDPNVFVVGDAACFFSENGKPLPGLAPVAMQEGKYVASVIERRMENEEPPKPFVYRDKGNLATIGRAAAIADFGKLRLSGFFAWLVWLSVHIFYLIGFRNRMLVMIQWAWSYFTYQRGARIITSREADDSSQLRSEHKG